MTVSLTSKSARSAHLGTTNQLVNEFFCEYLPSPGIGSVKKGNSSEGRKKKKKEKHRIQRAAMATLALIDCTDRNLDFSTVSEQRTPGNAQNVQLVTKRLVHELYQDHKTNSTTSEFQYVEK